MSHKFTLGQLVHSAGTRFVHQADGVYEIVRLMPEAPNGELGYRIRHTTSGTQRAVGESEIRAAAEKPRPFSAT